MPGAMHAAGAIQATLFQVANGCQLLLTDIYYILLLSYGILLSLFITYTAVLQALSQAPRVSVSIIIPVHTIRSYI